MKKKLISLVLGLAVLGTVLTGCSGKTEEKGGKTEGKSKVYLITMDQMDQHWVNVDAGAKKAVTELGNIEYTWLAPDVKDDAKQIEAINNAVAGGANAILLAANGPDAVTQAKKKKKNAGVKIIYVDSAADFPAEQTLATDNEAAGKTA